MQTVDTIHWNWSIGSELKIHVHIREFLFVQRWCFLVLIIDGRCDTLRAGEDRIWHCHLNFHTQLIYRLQMCCKKSLKWQRDLYVVMTSQDRTDFSPTNKVRRLYRRLSRLSLMARFNLARHCGAQGTTGLQHKSSNGIAMVGYRVERDAYWEWFCEM